MKRMAVWLAAAVALGVLPLLMPTVYFRHLLVMALIFAVYALGYNVQFGYAGLFNLGPSAFLGVGAYVSAIGATRYHWSFWTSIVAGAAVATVLAVALGTLTLRTRGPHFAMMTLGLGQVLYLLVTNTVDLTRGPLGISGIPSPTLHLLGSSFSFNNELRYYYLALAFLVVMYVLLEAALRSRAGSAWHCVRENENLAAALGISPFPAKLAAFTCGSVMSAVAGSLYAHYIHLVTPELLSVPYVVTVLIMVVVGGQGTFLGPVLGSVLFIMIPEGLRVAQNLRMAAFGLLLLVFIMFLPEGLTPFLTRMRWWRAAITPPGTDPGQQ